VSPFSILEALEHRLEWDLKINEKFVTKGQAQRLNRKPPAVTE